MIYLLLFLLVILSGLSVFLFNDTGGKKIKLLLSFSGAYLLSISLLHLIPEIYKSSENNSIGIYILLGFFIQILLEYFSKGIEHGHSLSPSEKSAHALPSEKEETHSHGNENISCAHQHNSSTSVSLGGIAVFISLCFHSFLEGMPLAKVVSEGDYFNKLLIGILLHNIPISIVLMSLLLKINNKTNAVLWLTFFALMLPLGSAANYLLEGRFSENISNYNHIVLAVVVGIFLHISTTILFESTENHRFNLYKFISILLGAGLAMVNW